MVGMRSNDGKERGRMMRKLFVLSLFVVASITFLGCSRAPKEKSGAGGSSVIMAEAEQEDFLEFMKQRANSGALFRNIMESFDEMCDIFDDCLGSDEVYMTMSLSSLREQLSVADATGDGFGGDAY